MHQSKDTEATQKQDSSICYLQETYIKPIDMQTKSQGMKNIFYPNREKKAGVAVLVSDKIDIKQRNKR